MGRIDFTTTIRVYKQHRTRRFHKDRYRVVALRAYDIGGHERFFYHGYTRIDAMLMVGVFKCLGV